MQLEKIIKKERGREWGNHSSSIEEFTISDTEAGFASSPSHPHRRGAFPSTPTHH